MIVVAEDDRDLREIVCEVLETHGYAVAAASNGAEALRLVRENQRVCLVLLDLMMPVMSGYEFLQIRQREPELATVPVVVMSARWEAAEQEVTGEFLRKPLSTTQLLGAAARYCND